MNSDANQQQQLLKPNSYMFATTDVPRHQGMTGSVSPSSINRGNFDEDMVDEAGDYDIDEYTPESESDLEEELFRDYDCWSSDEDVMALTTDEALIRN